MLFLLPRWKDATIDGEYDDRQGLCRREAFVLIACLGLAVAPAILTVPSIVNEMCAGVEPELQAQSLIPNLVWTTVSLFLTLGFFTYGFRRKRRRMPWQSLPEGKQRDVCPQPTLRPIISGQAVLNLSHLSDPDSSDSSATLQDEATREWQMSVPDSIIKQIFLVQTLKLMMQVVNTFLVWSGHELKCLLSTRTAI
eukprot:TRINITY_DN17767_c0_g2_i6.p2 TRINITY_DN17767_c0_g2~~TRINITY_DN17767_c0_g2_i6.p2  ORF type:complete len:196 (-),score=17.31 TRINITY_DN17767_c0_g2_i6:46-633(-)